MKTAFVLFCLSLGASAVLSLPTEDVDLENHWSDFKMKYNRHFANHKIEASRKKIFAENLKTIHRHNSDYARGLTTFTMGVGEYTDMTVEEASAMLVGAKSNLNVAVETGSTFISPANVKDLPTEVDWRKDGLVTPLIRKQKYCGSCYAISATGSIEGQWARKTGKLVSLSVQNIVDCSGRQGNYGCESGWMEKAFQYVIDNRGVDTEESYPYIDGENIRCKFNRESVGAQVTGYVSLASNNETQLLEAVATVGPISVVMHANLHAIIHYESGIFDAPCSTQFDHGVLIVGYGTENGVDYWIVKNSWGETWGENGYLRIVRNKNLCGIAVRPAYPLV